MINVVIIDKSLDYARYLMNFLSSINNNLRILAILTEIEELDNIVLKNGVDIILINDNLADYKILENNKILKTYLKSTIIITDNKKVDIKNLKVYSIIERTNDFSIIYKVINDCIVSKKNNNYINTELIKENIVIKKIENELKYLNVKIAYKGVKYLIEAIYLLYHFEEYYDCNLEKDIYPLIAKKYCKKASNIKSNINYAVNTLYAECEEEKLLNYLNGYSVYKPSPKRIILSILDSVKNTNIHS